MEITANTKAIIWDLDGTLLDSFEIYANVLAEALVLHQLPLPERSVLLTNFHGTLEDSIATALSLTDDKRLAAILSDFLVAQKQYYQVPDKHLFTDAVKLATRAAAAGLQQFVITNRTHTNRGSASPRHIIEHSRLAGAINDFVCSDENAFHKPDSRVALPLLARYGLQPSQVVVIGDQHVDAELAQNLGTRAIIVVRGEQSPHLDNINNWRHFTTVVTSLNKIKLVV